MYTTPCCGLQLLFQIELTHAPHYDVRGGVVLEAVGVAADGVDHLLRLTLLQQLQELNLQQEKVT